MGYFWDTLFSFPVQLSAEDSTDLNQEILSKYNDIGSIALQGVALSCKLEIALLTRRSQVGLLPGPPRNRYKHAIFISMPQLKQTSVLCWGYFNVPGAADTKATPQGAVCATSLLLS